MRLFSESEEDELNSLSSGMRWDYLASSEFKVRNETVLKLAAKHLPTAAGLRVLEIGGNPAPFIGYILNATQNASGISVEPYISPIAESIFQSLEVQGVKIIPSLTDLGEAKFNVVVFLGMDLSLAKDYLTLVKDSEIIANLLLHADLILTETPNYEPSKWLEDHFTTGLEKLESEVIKINAHLKYSISEDILVREISIWRNTSSTVNQKTLDSNNQLVRYAEWHAIQGTPRVNPLLRPRGDSGYDVQRLLNTWQVETAGTDGSFTWLKKNQRVHFPKKYKTLTINFIHGPKPKNQSHLLFSLEAHASKIVIRRRFRIRTIRFQLDSWIPSKMHNESSDHRSLTIAAISYEFS